MDDDGDRLPASTCAGAEAPVAAGKGTAGALDLGNNLPLWRQLKEILRREIGTAQSAHDARLPTEQSLAARFGVNRHTVRQALAGLQDEGLVRIEQGRGTFVVGKVIDYPIGERTRFGEILSRQALEATSLLLRALQVPAPPEVAEALEISIGDMVVVMDTARESEGTRISLSSHYFPAGRFDRLPDHFRSTRSVSQALALCGVENYRRRTTRISARLPGAEDARYLHQPRTRPILVTESINVDMDGAPIEYGLTRFNGDRIQVVVDFGNPSSPAAD